MDILVGGNKLNLKPKILNKYTNSQSSKRVRELLSSKLSANNTLLASSEAISLFSFNHSNNVTTEYKYPL